MKRVNLLVENSTQHFAFVKAFTKLGSKEDIFSFNYSYKEGGLFFHHARKKFKEGKKTSMGPLE